MRKLMVCAVMAAGALLPASAAEAYEGPWCLMANTGRTVSEICHFTTFEACRDERSLWGSTAFCVQNSRYLPYWQGRGFGEEPSRRSRRAKHRPQ
jgi:hypothetical protein